MLTNKRKLLLMATVTGALAFPMHGAHAQDTIKGGVVSEVTANNSLKTENKKSVTMEADTTAEAKVMHNDGPFEDARIIRTYGYDMDGDGIIEEDEMSSYIYKLTDENNDGKISDDEFQSGYAMTYFAKNNAETDAPDKRSAMSYWDKDKDNQLDASEMETLVTNVGLYKKWDLNADGKVSTAELSQGTFKAYDDNGDNMISIDEWTDVIH